MRVQLDPVFRQSFYECFYEKIRNEYCEQRTVYLEEEAQIGYTISERVSMVGVPKVYLETTIFNYYFDNERDAHPFTVKLFEEIASGKYAAFTSAYVVTELMDAPEPKRGNMLTLIERYGIEVFSFSDEAERLAEIYVGEGIVPTDGACQCARGLPQASDLPDVP